MTESGQDDELEPRDEQDATEQPPHDPRLTHISGDEPQALADVLVMLWDRRQVRLAKRQRES